MRAVLRKEKEGGDSQEGYDDQDRPWRGRSAARLIVGMLGQQGLLGFMLPVSLTDSNAEPIEDQL
jgi:hypothetical protein